MCNIVAPLVGRSRMVYARCFDAAKWHAAAMGSQAAVTWCYAVPTMWSLLLQHCDRMGGTLPPSLRLLRAGAAHMPHTVALRLSRMLAPRGCFLPTYSMTECMPISSPPLGYILDRPGSVGPPLGIRVRILNSVSGEVGEVSLMHDAASTDVTQLFEGYEAAGLHEPTGEGGGAEDGGGDGGDDGVGEGSGVEMGAHMFRPFKTGDLGRMDSGGWLFLTGRIKEVIDRGGEQLSPARIEAVLGDHPLIDEVMAFSSSSKVARVVTFLTSYAWARAVKISLEAVQRSSPVPILCGRF